jgi:ComF family protein
MRALADLVFPPSCLSCTRAGSRVLCEACLACFPWITEMCARCGRPVPRSVSRCADCRAPEPAFSVARAPAAYRGVARDVLMSFKLGGERRAARWMAVTMARCAETMRADVLTFVPSSRASMAERGFNTAHELARALSKAVRLPNVRLLSKIRETADQASLDRAGRRTNLAGAFASAPAPSRVILVDDVMTTGATADACARALRAAGALDVLVVTFARAGDQPPPGPP